VNGEYLLDTHVWLWGLVDPGRLAKKVRALLAAPGATLWLSPMSVWETSLLVERGRLEVDTDARTWIQDAIASSGVIEAPVNHEVALQSREVLVRHDDPADRFIAATASVYQLTLITADERLLRGKGYETIRA
jgi:PIN domain nuclease of toxin-antitoxin system